jgi:hypothetical protein
MAWLEKQIYSLNGKLNGFNSEAAVDKKKRGRKGKKNKQRKK